MSGLKEKTNDLPGLIRQALFHTLSQVRVMMPAQIESYSPSENLAQVKPLIQQRYSDDTFKPIPVINQVPVQWMRTARAGITMDLVKGDLGSIVFSDRSLEDWLQLGGDNEPEDPRIHSLNDAVFIPGLYPFGQGDDITVDGLKARHNGAAMKLKDSKVALGVEGGDELLNLVSQLANLTATSTANGFPLSNAAQISAVKSKIDAITGTV